MKNGVYKETISITDDKSSIKIIASGKEVIMDGSTLQMNSNAFTITGNVVNVKIKGFHIRNYGGNGILLVGAKSCIIKKNTIYNNTTGIFVSSPSFDNQITDNSIFNNANGITSVNTNDNYYSYNMIYQNTGNGFILNQSNGETVL